MNVIGKNVIERIPKGKFGATGDRRGGRKKVQEKNRSEHRQWKKSDRKALRVWSNSSRNGVCRYGWTLLITWFC